MSVLFWVCFVFVCGMMCHRFVEGFYYKMDSRNIYTIVLNGMEIIAFVYFLKVMGG